MSNSITPRIAPQFVPQSAPSESAAHPTQPSVAAEEQASIFQRLPTSASVTRPLALPVAHLTAARKKAQPSDFAAPEEEGKDKNAESLAKPAATIPAVQQTGGQSNSETSSNGRDQTQFVYQRKFDELTQICVQGMSVADTAHAKELAMQVVLCANVLTLNKKKSVRELSQIIGQTVQKLALGGVSLPTDTENLLDLLKTQSAHLSSHLRMQFEDRNSITGHLLPLLLLASRWQTPVLPGFSSRFMYQVRA